MPDWTPRTAAEHNTRYGHFHRKLRREWDARVQTGGVDCSACGGPIYPGAAWDLGHVPNSSQYAGPQHRECNRRTGATGERGRNSASQQQRDPNPPPQCARSLDHNRYWSARRLASQTDQPSAMVCTPGGGHVVRWLAE